MLHVHSCDGQYALCYNYEKIHHRHYIIIAYDERGGGQCSLRISCALDRMP